MDRNFRKQTEAGLWPAGFRGAVALTFDVDAESVMLAADPEHAERASLMSHQRYGPAVGVPRILRILAERGLRATFFVPGYTAEQHPEVVAAICGGGHEIAHHGYLHELLTSAGEAAEREYLERGLEALDKIAGVRPAGYRAPWWETTPRTLGLLAEYGFSYDSSLFDADLPGIRQTPDGEIVEIPVSWALDDWERYAFWPGVTGSGVIERASAVAEHWWEEVLAYEDEGGCCVLTMHPFLSGRPARAKALAGLIDRITERGLMWVASMGEIAERTRTAIAMTSRACWACGGGPGSLGDLAHACDPHETAFGDAVDQTGQRLGPGRPTGKEGVHGEHAAATLVLVGQHLFPPVLGHGRGPLDNPGTGDAGPEGIALPVVQRPGHRDLHNLAVRRLPDARQVGVEQAAVVAEPVLGEQAERAGRCLPPWCPVPGRADSSNLVECF